MRMSTKMIVVLVLPALAVSGVIGGALKSTHDNDDPDRNDEPVSGLMGTAEKKVSSSETFDDDAKSVRNREAVTSLQHSPEDSSSSLEDKIIKELEIPSENITQTIEGFKSQLDNWSIVDPDILLEPPAGVEGKLTEKEQEQINVILWEGANRGNLPIMKLAMLRGANIDYQITGYESTPLIAATLHNHVQAVRLLVLHGADVDVMDRINKTALYYAARDALDEIVQLLIRAGADVNKKVVRGRTALIVAAKKNHMETARYLIKAGADFSIKDDDNLNAYNYAKFGTKGVIDEW